MATEQQWRLVMPLSYLDPHKTKRSRCVRKLMESHPSVVRSHRTITVDEIQDERKHHTNRESGNMIRRSTPRFISKKKK